MRLNANQAVAREVTVFLNGEKEPDAFEVYIPGNVLEGQGYVVRGVTIDGKQVATRDACHPLPPCRFDSSGALCEKVFGHIRIEIAEYADSPFIGDEHLIPGEPTSQSRPTGA
jgi:hypothetical protein